MDANIAQFRFYEELNDFLSRNKKKKTFDYSFKGKPSVKDAIEAQGIPHTEVDLITVNGISVGFDYLLITGDNVSVYPMFESFDISPIIKLREKPLRNTMFVLDVHLGKLARILRMLGFNTLYQNNYSDAEIIEIGSVEKRIILTRDKGILKNKAVTHGYWIRSIKPVDQAREVLKRFDLSIQIKPFQRYIECNGLIIKNPKNEILTRLPMMAVKHFDEFSRCENCHKIYWKGSHYDRMKEKINFIIN